MSVQADLFSGYGERLFSLWLIRLLQHTPANDAVRVRAVDPLRERHPCSISKGDTDIADGRLGWRREDDRSGLEPRAGVVCVHHPPRRTQGRTLWLAIQGR